MTQVSVQPPENGPFGVSKMKGGNGHVACNDGDRAWVKEKYQIIIRIFKLANFF
ncbi:hypothetical protein [Sunxiuqinia rutila]|uniref:hypothetical protein n=1 Tax=Sunxiuqinia rutila TaxID=1397841 RepID=UPI003D35AD0E